jgi:hypothetical protein
VGRHQGETQGTKRDTHRPAVRTVLLVTTLAATAAPGCQTKAEPRAVEVTLRDAAGATLVTLVRNATGCTAEPGAVAITAGKGTASDGSWTLGPGAAGPELRGPGDARYRVVSEETPARRLSIIDAIGVPLVRVTFGADATTVADGARARIGRIDQDPAGLRFFDETTGAPGAIVTGASDVPAPARLEIAAPLLAPADLPVPARALLACERLAAVTPAVK